MGQARRPWRMQPMRLAGRVTWHVWQSSHMAAETVQLVQHAADVARQHQLGRAAVQLAADSTPDHGAPGYASTAEARHAGASAQPH